jgi:hypothetical protein
VARTQGQRPTEFEKAKETMERQDALVDKLLTKRNQLKAQLDEVEDALLVEDELLKYYMNHPVLQVKDHRKILQPMDTDEPRYDDEPQLPLDTPTWKGFKSNYVKEEVK